MPGCSVKSCKNWNGNTKNKNIKYFSFPKDENLLKIWLDVCIPNVNLKNGRVCSVHFSPDSFQDTSHLYIPGKPPVLKLQKNAVPTLCLECVEQKQRKRGRQALGGNSCSDKESYAKVVKFDKAEQNEHKTNLILPHDQEKISTSVSQQLSQVNANNCTDEPWSVLLCLVRTRTYIRLRELNRIRKESNTKIRIVSRSARNLKFYM